jgi:hypothetical protein
LSAPAHSRWLLADRIHPFRANCNNSLLRYSLLVYALVQIFIG